MLIPTRFQSGPICYGKRMCRNWKHDSLERRNHVPKATDSIVLTLERHIISEWGSRHANAIGINIDVFVAKR